jgi:hypothetical protein
MVKPILFRLGLFAANDGQSLWTVPFLIHDSYNFSLQTHGTKSSGWLFAIFLSLSLNHLSCAFLF